jgi:glycine/D-amino acid oxidase-like deaminating enzyme
VLEAGWIGGGNTGRNTTIVRSNYLYPQSARLYDFSLRQYEQLAAELNFNIMFSQRGVLTLAHSRHDLDAQSRWANAMLCNGIDAELLDATAGARHRAAPELRRCLAAGALPHPGRLHPAPRRPGAARRGGLGLCARCVGAGRGHRAELRRDRLRQAGRAWSA